MSGTTGWICPICGMGVAPWMPQHCAPPATGLGSGTPAPPTISPSAILGYVSATGALHPTSSSIAFGGPTDVPATE